MSNNKELLEKQLARVHQLMGINKEVNESKNFEIGTIIKSEKGADGNTYAIVKENKYFYLKKSSKDKDLVLEDFNYLGGSEVHKKLFMYESLNSAEKYLVEELNKLTKEAGAQRKLNEQKKEYKNNLTSSTQSRTMREEIDRYKRIAGIVSEGKLDELSLDSDNTILKDEAAEDPTEIDIQTEPDGGADIEVEPEGLPDEIGEPVPADDPELPGEDLEAQDVALDTKMTQQIPELSDELSQLRGAIEDLKASIDGEDLGEEVGEEPLPPDVGEEPVNPDVETGGDFDESVNKELDHESEEGFPEVDPLADDNYLGEEDNMGNVPMAEQEEYDFTLGPKEGKNIADHEGDDIKDDEFTIHRALEEGTKYYIVNESGDVYGNFKGTRKWDKLPTKSGTGKVGDGAPFTNKVKKTESKEPAQVVHEQKIDQITNIIMQECVKAGIFVQKK